MITVPWWIITVCVFATPFLFFIALALWIYVLAARMPYARAERRRSEALNQRLTDRVPTRW